MTHKKIIMGGVLTLLLGFLLGLAGARPLFHLMGHQHSEEHMMKRFSSELDLTPEQQIQVKSILDQQREGLQALRTNFRPQLEQVKKEAREKIRQILDPVQQQKFDQLETRWKRKRNAEPSDHSNF